MATEKKKATAKPAAKAGAAEAKKADSKAASKADSKTNGKTAPSKADAKDGKDSKKAPKKADAKDSKKAPKKEAKKPSAKAKPAPAEDEDAAEPGAETEADAEPGAADAGEGEDAGADADADADADAGADADAEPDADADGEEEAKKPKKAAKAPKKAAKKAPAKGKKAAADGEENDEGEEGAKAAPVRVTSVVNDVFTQTGLGKVQKEANADLGIVSEAKEYVSTLIKKAAADVDSSETGVKTADKVRASVDAVFPEELAKGANEAIEEVLARWAEAGGNARNNAKVARCAVFEYLARTIFKMAGEATRGKDRKRLTCAYINLAIRGDKELKTLLDEHLTAE